MSIITIALLLLAGVGSTLGTTYFYILNKDKVPAAQITNLASEQVIQAGRVEIRGTAAAEEGEIQAILVKVDEGPAVFATPNAVDDFSSWSALIDVPSSGTHNIEVEVVDAEGMTHSTTQSVTITEPAPSLAPPPDQVVEAIGAEGAYANYPAPEVKGDKTDIMDPECSPLSGTLFPIGITEVTCIAHRSDGSTLAANFTLSVRDTTPPTIEPPRDVTRKNSDNSTANGWLGKPSVSDIVDDNPMISNDVPFYGFPTGTTAVVWTATDDYGNFAQAVQIVTITSETIVGDEAVGSNTTSDSGTSDSGTGQGSESSVTYGNGGGGGGGGGGSSKGDNGKGNGNGKNTPPGSGGSSGNTSTASQTKLVTASVNLNGSPKAGMFTTIKSSSGATLLTGYTPLTFIGNNNAIYTVTISDNNTAVFDHWDNEATSATRSVTLNQNTTITAYYDNTYPPAIDTTRPSVTITNPTTGLVMEPGTLAVQGTSSDNAGGSGISTLQVRLDSGSYITATPKSAGDWSTWTASFGAVAAGQHTIYAKATDNASNLEEVSVSIEAATSPGDTTVPTVSASPQGGTYSSAMSIALSANEPATIYYTTNGNTPTTSSQVYASPISISATTTLKFVAEDTAGNVGAVASQSYVIDAIAPSVTATPTGGTYGTSQTISLSSNEQATIYYTTNGNTPTTSSQVYSSPITIASTTTLKYFARDTAGNSGNVVTRLYTIDTILPTVAASPLGGVYSSSQSVTLSTTESGTIYYTTNGNTPTSSSPVYSSPITIASTTTLKYFARDTAGNSGNVVAQTYTIDSTPPTVTASPSGGTYSSSRSVTLSANEQANIYYTTNGNTPTFSSQVYASPISITTTTSLKFVAIDTAGNSGGVSSQTYVIDVSLPTVTASPLGGTFSSTQAVTLSASEPATIYYTTNGNTPTTSSQVYSSPITIASTTTLKYFARDTAGNSGNVVTQIYSIQQPSTLSVLITSPVAGKVFDPAQPIPVTGTASGSGIATVEVTLREPATAVGQSYLLATPKAAGDWSTWSASLNVLDQTFTRILARVTDSAGNVAYQSLEIVYQGSPPPDPDPDPDPDPIPEPPPLPTEELPPSVGPVLHATNISDLFIKIGAASPGQWVELANGSYDNPTSRAISRNGVIVKAETVGGVTITGQSIDITGQGAWMYGFVLKTTGTIDLDGSGAVFKRNTVNLVNTGVWFDFRAPDVVVDYNEISGKSNSGYTFRNSDTSAVRMKITHNYIHDLTGADSMIMLGHSSMSHWDNFAEIAYNRMERINIGDPEIITFKSSGANFHDNTVITATSGFTFRQGHNNKFTDNTLIGVGLRIYGHGHTVTGNQFIDDPNRQLLQSLYIGSANILDYPDSSNAYYAEVRDCTFENNIVIKTITGGDIPLTVGHGGYGMPPQSNTFKNNIVYGTAGGTLTDTGGSASWAQQTLSGNIVYATGSASRGDMPSQNIDPQLVKGTDGIYRFSTNSPLKWTQNNDLLTTAEVGPMAP